MLFHSLLLSLIVGNYVLVICSSNPVYSVLFLILSFCCVSILLFFFSVEFLGALFLIIYVGAIAVLFLFVVMMLNIKIKSQISQSTGLLVLLTSLIVSIFLTKILDLVFGPGNLFLGELGYEKCFDVYSNLSVFGQVLYGYHILLFLLAGIVLLVAVIGAIILTLGLKKKVSADLVSRQLSRSANIIIAFK